MKIGRRPMGTLNFETKRMGLLGNAKIRDDYDWLKENKRMRKGVGIEKGATTGRRDWCCLFVPGIDLPKFSKLKQSVINIRNKQLAKCVKNLTSIEQEHEK